MSGRVEGKVALITGAARGQGRSHAIELAREGADIIAIDICRSIDTNPYPLSTPEDLEETARLVKALGRQIVTRQADVRQRDELRTAVDEGISQLGHIDVVVANAGICPIGNQSAQAFVDAVDVDLVGVINAVSVTLPHVPDGASYVITGSTAALMPGAIDNPAFGAGGAGYSYAKRILVSYTEALALQLASRMIRVNAVHPTNCDTHLLHQEGLYRVFRPDLERPTRDDAMPALTMLQAMPIPYVDPVDISNVVLFLASDESRYVTGQQIRVDGGSLLKFPQGLG